MPWKAVQMSNLAASMTECDQSTLPVFRRRYGFYEAKNLHMFYGNRGPYEARPLIAAAYANLFPLAAPIKSTDFMNNDAHEFLVQSFNFVAKDI